MNTTHWFASRLRFLCYTCVQLVSFLAMDHHLNAFEKNTAQLQTNTDTRLRYPTHTQPSLT